jgi:hypothetical protein
VLAWAWKRRWRLAAAVLVAAAGGYFGFYEDTRSWWMAVCHRAGRRICRFSCVPC